MKDRILVTGIQRSGTTYISRLLSSLGLPCGHEAFFHPNNLRISGPFERARFYEPGRLNEAFLLTCWCESSWLGAPYLADLPDGTVVLHQMRHPLAVLRSILGQTFLAIPRNAHLVFAEQMHGASQGGEVERAMHHMVSWDAFARRAEQLPNLIYLRYRIEDLDATLLAEILALLDHAVSRDAGSRALSALPVDLNTAGYKEPPAAFSWETLPSNGLAEFRQFAERQGYL